MINVIINGVLGKMGRMLHDTISACEDMRVVAGVDRFAAGQKAAFPLFEKLSEVAGIEADVLIDFSRHDAIRDTMAFIMEKDMAAVIATTGHTQEEYALIEETAKLRPVFKSANMSLGANLLLDLSVTAAHALGGFDIEIVEKHHNAKPDAPSGTALVIAEELRSIREGELVFGRHAKDERRKPSEIGVHALRGGTVVGEHEVSFFGPDEVVTVSHSARSRLIFAQGAVAAARFIVTVGKPARVYNMFDVIHVPVSSVQVIEDEALVAVELDRASHPAAKLFNLLASHNINVDMISQTYSASGRAGISFTIPRSDAPLAQEAFKGMELEASILSDICKLNVEGPGMERQAGIAAKLFDRLSAANVDILLVTTSETKISLCVRREDAAWAEDTIRAAFGVA